MLQLARNNRVLWLNSVGTRAPNLASGRDLKKIFLKIAGFFRGARQVRENLWVYTPLVLPMPHSPLAAAVNRWFLRTLVGIQRRKLGMKSFQLWTFLPNVNDYVGKMGESMSVYYCTDEWSKFSYVDGPRIAAAEQDLIRKVDVVFATAQSLVDTRIGNNPQTYLARHGVDYELFATAILPDTQVPEDIATIPQPIVGFYGLIQDWIDVDLIEHLARRHPEWSIVLIGKSLIDVTRLSNHSNVHLLGRRAYADLPRYCKAFSVGIIPFQMKDLIHHVNPLKLREYLSSGLPVVSTAMPEVLKCGDLCISATSYDEFERAVAESLSANSPELRRRRSEAMKAESWERKVSQVCDHVMAVKDAKQARAVGSPNLAVHG
jgi:hypothetical protein